MTPTLLLTRSPADNERLAEQCRRLGIATRHLPLLQIQPLAESDRQRQYLLDIDHYQAVIVVSPVAARLGLERLDQYWPQMPVGIDWFAVGKTTAASLAAAGLPAQAPENGQDSEALLRLPRLQALLAEDPLRVLIWRGQGGREHLAEQIRAAGGRVDYLELYRRAPAERLSEALQQAASDDVRGILVLSVQALEFWHQAAGADWPRHAAWRCWVPSQRVADRAAALGCRDVIVCNGADDCAVIEAIQAHPLT